MRAFSRYSARKKFCAGIRVARHRGFIQHANVATGAKTALARPVDQHQLHRPIVFPPCKSGVDTVHHHLG